MADKVKKKLNREDIVERAAKKCSLSQSEILEAVLAFEDVMKEMALEGHMVCLTGFGKFYLQRHKGHPIQFADGKSRTPDYVVYKYSASNVWNNTLREADEKHPIPIG